MRIRELVERREWEIQVLVGERALDREIRWIHSTDLLDPSPYLRGGKVILTNGLWREDPGDAARFVGALTDRGVHALGYAVFEPGSVPADVRDACQSAGLPLLELPNVPFMEIAEQVLEQLLRERSAVPLAVDELQPRLEAVSTLGELASVLAWHCDRPVWICDRAGGLLADTGAAPPASRVGAAWLAAMAASASASALPVEVAGEQPATAVAVGGAGDGSGPPVAVIAVEDGAEATSEALRRAARVAATLAAERPPRLRDARLLHDGRAATAGVVVAVAAAWLADDALADALDAACRLSGRDAVVAAGDGAAFALVASAGGADAAALGQAALTFAQALSGDAVAVGVSRVAAGAEQLSRQLEEARRALRHARELPAPAIVHGDELGRSALLLAALDEELRATFAGSVLDPLVRYDREHRSEMLRTLQVFVGSGGSWVESARTLHLHVNTLRYRVARIEELTGRSLTTVDARVDFYLALRAGGHEVPGVG